VVVIVFILSVFSGMGVLVARFSGADDAESVNRTVYQAFLLTTALSLGVMAPLGYVLAPGLLGFVHAAPEVRLEALPYLRILFMFSFGMMVFFMTGGAFRSAGDARTPLRLGILLTALNVGLNVILIRGLGPIPAFGTRGAAMGTVIAGGVVSVIVLWMLFSQHAVVAFHRAMDWRPDWAIIRELFRFGLPTGVQGIAMNVGGVFLLRFIGSLDRSAEAHAAYTVSYGQLFSFITWTSVGLMGAAAAVSGQNLGAGRPERTVQAVRVASRIGLGMAAVMGLLFLTVPRALLAVFGMNDPGVVDLGVELLAFLSLSGLFVTVALTYTGGLQGTGDTKSPLYISIVSQLVLPLGICAALQATVGLRPTDIWIAIVIGHFTRAMLSVIRFRQEKWRGIEIRADVGSGSNGAAMPADPLDPTVRSVPAAEAGS
jgi:putative MATE family efflux protein